MSPYGGVRVGPAWVAKAVPAVAAKARYLRNASDKSLNVEGHLLRPGEVAGEADGYRASAMLLHEDIREVAEEEFLAEQAKVPVIKIRSPKLVRPETEKPSEGEVVEPEAETIKEE